MGEAVALRSALGLPPVPIPPERPPTAATIELGRQLFSSPDLSVDGTRSCAACHQPAHAFAEEAATSLGVRRQRGKRNAPTLLNAAFLPLQFHDGRADSLEAQASGPILNPIEMAHSKESLLAKLNGSAAWRTKFAAAFGAAAITLDQVTYALAAYERTLISGNSPFDRFAYGGDPSALSPAAQRGLALFRDPQRGNCVACHTIGREYALFTDGLFHNLGAGMDARGELSDLGRYEVTKEERDRGAFRTPTLRNVALTAPYMHDGSLKSLKEVVEFYIAGGNANPQLDPQMRPITLSRQERDDLIAFLESLTGEQP